MSKKPPPAVMAKSPPAEKTAEKPVVVMRPKRPGKRSSRPISCKDLGGGDCEGWLLKKDSGRLRDSWHKYWFVLRNRDLYYYKQPTDDSYVGRFNLAGFTISPIEKEKSQKFAFRVHHDKVGTFIFASDRQLDMAKWMNKLGLASILNGGLPTIGEDGEGGGCHSCSDDDESDGTSVVSGPDTMSPSQSRLTSPTESIRCSVSTDDDGIGELVHTLRDSRVDLLGDARIALEAHRRLTHFKVAAAAASAAEPNDVANPTAPTNCHRNASCSHLLAKKRTLKDKESELAAIDDLLACLPVTSDALLHFRQQHQPIIEKLTTTNDNNNDQRFSCQQQVTS